VPLRYTFLDEEIGRQYGSEQRLGRVFGTFTVLALLIACLGLFGLAAYAAEQRTKEVGIRKVLGARASQVVALLSKDFLVLVAVAFAVGAPVAYLAAERWLGTFAYHAALRPGVFVAAGLLTLAVALATVAGQALRAAAVDPVKALRYE
jgi:putative ABC transport system permease protein